MVSLTAQVGFEAGLDVVVLARLTPVIATTVILVAWVSDPRIIATAPTGFDTITGLGITVGGRSSLSELQDLHVYEPSPFSKSEICCWDNLS